MNNLEYSASKEDGSNRSDIVSLQNISQPFSGLKTDDKTWKKGGKATFYEAGEYFLAAVCEIAVINFFVLCP